jgi:hypothetical protein
MEAPELTCQEVFENFSQFMLNKIEEVEQENQNKE